MLAAAQPTLALSSKDHRPFPATRRPCLGLDRAAGYYYCRSFLRDSQCEPTKVGVL
jgi:hypothetical protein